MVIAIVSHRAVCYKVVVEDVVVALILSSRLLSHSVLVFVLIVDLELSKRLFEDASLDERALLELNVGKFYVRKTPRRMGNLPTNPRIKIMCSRLPHKLSVLMSLDFCLLQRRLRRWIQGTLYFISYDALVAGLDVHIDSLLVHLESVDTALVFVFDYLVKDLLVLHVDVVEYLGVLPGLLNIVAMSQPGRAVLTEHDVLLRRVAVLVCDGVDVHEVGMKFDWLFLLCAGAADYRTRICKTLALEIKLLQ